MVGQFVTGARQSGSNLRGSDSARLLDDRRHAADGGSIDIFPCADVLILVTHIGGRVKDEDLHLADSRSADPGRKRVFQFIDVTGFPTAATLSRRSADDNLVASRHNRGLEFEIPVRSTNRRMPDELCATDPEVLLGRCVMLAVERMVIVVQQRREVGLRDSQHLVGRADGIVSTHNC